MKILVVDRAREAYETRYDPRHGIQHLLEIYRFAVTRPPTGGL
jgi:hypothetical protein